MLIPRFTIRTLLVITTLCAIFASTISWALSGAGWAFAVASATSMFVVAMVFYCLLFAISYVISRLLGRQEKQVDNSVPVQEGLQ